MSVVDNAEFSDRAASRNLQLYFSEFVRVGKRHE